MRSRRSPSFFVATTLIASTIVQLALMAVPSKAADPLQEIRATFPDSITIRTNKSRSAEFCPDNTCEVFKTTKIGPMESLADFTYLFLYFFSDYYVLEEWRNQPGAGVIAEEILSKKMYQRRCERDATTGIRARCLLQYLARRHQIRIYFVRYDENVRATVPITLSKALAEIRVRPPAK